MKNATTIFILLMGADVLTTLYAINELGLAEGNPFGRFILSHGDIALALVKLAAIAIILVPVWRYQRWKPMRYWLLGCNILMACVVLSNTFHILQRIMIGGHN